jgi:hypothetical protein
MKMITCFIIMPIGNMSRDPEKHELWSELYFDHIKPTIEGMDKNISCIRADEILQSGSIIDDVVDHIAKSEISIVEMTDQNPNVFYELGVRHALSSSTILIAQNTSDIPFDLRDNRAIIYKFTPRGITKFKETLRNYVQNILDNPTRPDNPVQSYLQKKPRIFSVEPVLDSNKLHEHNILLDELLEIKKQNKSLSKFIKEIRSVITGSISINSSIQSMDLTGTWTDIAFINEKKYAKYVDSFLIFSYNGRWPGVMWGKVDDNIYRFSWSRFSEELSGKGYLKISESQAELQGGIWFDDRDLEDQDMDSKQSEDPIGWVEKHHLLKNSIVIDESGSVVMQYALVWLRNKSIIK